MTTEHVEARPGAYADSVTLMQASADVRRADGVEAALIAMATELNLGLVTGTATARVTSAGHGGIRIAVISAGGIPVAALGRLGDITLPLPALPLGMTIQDVGVTGQGVLLHLASQDVRFGG